MENDTEKNLPAPAPEKKKRPATAGEKLAFLWRDKRNWKQRLFNALPVSFAIAYTFFLFQPLEVFIKNDSFLPFRIRHPIHCPVEKPYRVRIWRTRPSPFVSS